MDIALSVSTKKNIRNEIKQAASAQLNSFYWFHVNNSTSESGEIVLFMGYLLSSVLYVVNGMSQIKRNDRKFCQRIVPITSLYRKMVATLDQ